MKLLDKKTSADLTRLLVFIVVTTLATGVLVVTIGNLSFQGSKDYQAVFADVTGMNKGDDVRIAGVKVGTVGDIEAIASDADEDGAQARVTFSVQDGTALRESTHATIRYRNLVGQRYIALTEDVGSTTELDPGDTIPMEQTTPALDLTLLFNGFKPLFEALSPDDLNKLSFEVIQVFQGQGGTLESLLESTASVTQTLADRDAIIGQLLENLDFVLDRLADRDEQLSATIISFRDLVAGLRRLTRSRDDGKAEIDRARQVLPIKLEKVGRTAIYGSWFNFYLCDFKGRVSLPGVTVPVDFNVGAERCDLG